MNVKIKKRVVFILLLFVFFLCNGLILKQIIIGPVYSSGKSMSPTFKYHTLSVGGYPSNIKRGDIVTAEFKRDQEYTVIKRVIGLPGETVDIINGEVFINGEKLKEDYVTDTSCIQGYEWMCGKLHTQDFLEPLHLKGDRIPKGYYLLLGDNRSKSLDGRIFGLVHEKEIRCKVLLVALNIDQNEVKWLDKGLNKLKWMYQNYFSKV
jgi:signal peptidase I